MFIGVFVVFFYLMAFLMSNASIVLQLVGSWFTFKKMGMPGWKGLIPFYSTYCLFERLWDVKQFWRMIIYLCVYFGAVMFGFIFLAFGGAFAAGGRSYVGMGISGIVFIVLGVSMLIGAVVMLIMAIVLEFQLYKRLARAFVLKDAWAWGLLFVPFVMFPIIGFHKRICYYGPVYQA